MNIVVEMCAVNTTLVEFVIMAVALSHLWLLVMGLFLWVVLVGIVVAVSIGLALDFVFVAVGGGLASSEYLTFW